MSPEECMAAVGREEVVLRTVQGDEYARGFLISYSIVPAVTIETADGERISWRHDLADIKEHE